MTEHHDRSNRGVMTEHDMKTIEGWQEPPPKREPRYDWASIARRLKRRPNKWALIFEHDLTSLSVAIRKGAIQSLHPDKGFEVRTANNDYKVKPRTCSMWVRYNPDRKKVDA